MPTLFAQTWEPQRELVALYRAPGADEEDPFDSLPVVAFGLDSVGHLHPIVFDAVTKELVAASDLVGFYGLAPETETEAEDTEPPAAAGGG
jgi:hypothetical protein